MFYSYAIFTFIVSCFLYKKKRQLTLLTVSLLREWAKAALNLQRFTAAREKFVIDRFPGHSVTLEFQGALNGQGKKIRKRRLRKRWLHKRLRWISLASW